MTITQQEAQWIQETVEKLKTKWKPVTERNVGKIPYSSKDGVFDDYSPKEKVAWWTNGFWGGIMWQMYTLTGDDLYKKSAKELEDKLDQVLMDSPGLDHDNGFKWLPTAVPLFIGKLFHLDVGDLQVMKLYQVAVQPFAVRLFFRIVFFQLFILKDLMLHRIHKKHFSGMQTLL